MTTMPQHASTPPAGTGTIPQSLSLKSLSTPYSRGSGSHHSHQSQHYQDHYKPYLREDLAHQYKPEIPFDVFLNDILCHGLSLDNADQLQNHEFVSDKQFQTLLSRFCEPVHQETGHYTPFIELTNYVIGQFNNPESRIVFCRNDPVSIRGSDAIRKPDVVVVLDKSLEVPERGGVSNLMKGGPKQVPFWWTELLAFFEFEHVEKCLEPVRGDDCSSTFIFILPFMRNIYGSVGVELSYRSIAFTVYTPHSTRRTLSVYDEPPPRFALINPFGSRVKAKRQYPLFKPITQIKEAEARQPWN